MIEKDLLYGKKPVIFPGNEDRRSHNNDNEAFRTDDNLEDREDKFVAQLDSKYVYRIPLREIFRGKFITGKNYWFFAIQKIFFSHF